ncbi:MAG: hypothetical protein IPG32_16330 [Saprospirales bacterium]|nr:hypothetical protein [Saprospirales bacterium]
MSETRGLFGDYRYGCLRGPNGADYSAGVRGSLRGLNVVNKFSGIVGCGCIIKGDSMRLFTYRTSTPDFIRGYEYLTLSGFQRLALSGLLSVTIASGVMKSKPFLGFFEGGRHPTEGPECRGYKS